MGEPTRKLEVEVMSQAEMEAAEAQAERNFSEARSELVIRANLTFWAVAGLRLRYKTLWSIPTAATDGRHIFVNPAFWNGLSSDERMGVFAHEVSHCLAPGTSVYTKDGLKPIEAIQPDDYVFSGKYEWTRVKRIGSRHYSGEALTITPALGDPFTITPGHRVRVLRLPEGAWKRSLGLRKSLLANPCKNYLWLDCADLDPKRDLLCFTPPNRHSRKKLRSFRTRMRDKGQQTVLFDEEIAYLTGRWVADGHLADGGKKGAWFGDGSSKRVVGWTCGHAKDHATLTDIIERRLGRQPSTYDLAPTKAYRTIVSAKAYARFLSAHFLTADGEKKIPAWLLDHPPAIIEAFIKGYAEGDGHVLRDQSSIRVTTTSQAIAGNLALALWKLGEAPSVKCKEPSKSGYANGKPQWVIQWSPDTLAGGTVVKNGNVMLIPIRKITRAPYDGQVYNIATTTESYALPSLTVHNCVLLHCSPARKGSRENWRWQGAVDCAVNDTLRDHFTLPGDCIYPETFKLERGLCAEEYYARIPDTPKNRRMLGAGLSTGEAIPTPQDGSFTGSEAEWQVIADQALAAARMRGCVPAGMDRLIGQNLSRVNWRDALQQFLQPVRDDYSWAYPSRRFIHAGHYLPGKGISSEMGTLVVLLDASGSMSDEDLAIAAAEIEAATMLHPRRVVVMVHETHVTQRSEWCPEDGSFKLPSVKGGGGTSHVDAFEKVGELADAPEAVIAFTDLYSEFPPSPVVPVLWVHRGAKPDCAPGWGTFISIPE